MTAGVAWQTLVLRYADGRPVCNCRDAYYDERGMCKWGCQVSQLDARDDIAAKIVNELAWLTRELGDTSNNLNAAIERADTATALLRRHEGHDPAIREFLDAVNAE